MQIKTGSILLFMTLFTSKTFTNKKRQLSHWSRNIYINWLDILSWLFPDWRDNIPGLLFLVNTAEDPCTFDNTDVQMSFLKLGIFDTKVSINIKRIDDLYCNKKRNLLNIFLVLYAWLIDKLIVYLMSFVVLILTNKHLPHLYNINI